MSLIQSAMQTVVRLLPDKNSDPLIENFKALGTPLSRVDASVKVTGGARFAAEVSLDNLAYAALVYGTIARGKIATIDTATADAAPGVLHVMTYKNAPRMKAPLPLMSNPKGASVSDLPVMQDASIHWNGEAVAIVVARTQEQADFAASLVRVTYEVATAEVSFDHAKPKATSPATIMREPNEIKIGNAEAALAKSAVRVDRTYRTPRHSHCAIELHAATVMWEGDTLVVHDATQMLNLERSTLAETFGIPEANVRIYSPFVGGGFGGKGLWSYQILAIAAAKVVGRPVRIVLSREGVFRIVGGRTVTEQRVALGANTDGTLDALIHTGVTAKTSHNNVAEQFSFPARHFYAAKTFHIAQTLVDLDTIANTFMRAPGESVGTFALECAIDELAEKLNLDPIELRRRLEPEKDPTSGLPFSSRNIVEAYDRGAAAFGWQHRNRAPGATRDGEWLIGHGVATATYPYYRMPGGSARIRLLRDGRAIVQMASHEMGMGTATVQAQHAADRLGLLVEQVTFEYGDSDLPPGTIAGGSSQTASIAAAIIAAHAVLLKDVIKLAGNDSPIAGLKPDELIAREGGLFSIADPTVGESYVSILARAGRDSVEAEAAAPMPLEVMKYSMHSFGAQFCEVRVSSVTGEVRVSRFLGSFDVGRILNPKMARSQLRGGIIMGLGLALTEETLFDERTGRIMNPSLAEYHVPVHLDVPKIDVLWTDLPDPMAPLGAHGIGEIGITGVGAAVANAIANAIGHRFYEVPITLDKVLAALDANRPQ